MERGKKVGAHIYYFCPKYGEEFRLLGHYRERVCTREKCSDCWIGSPEL